MATNILTPVLAENEISRLRRALATLLRYSGNGIYSLVKKQDWVAVPCESGYHFSKDDANRLVRAIPGSSQLWGFALETLKDFPVAFMVPATDQGIDSFNRAVAHFNFALFPEDLSWLIICTLDEYFVVAGPNDFVRKVVGEELNVAFAHFFEFANDPEWSQKVHQILVSVFNSLYYNYARTPDGAFVSFPKVVVTL